MGTDLVTQEEKKLGAKVALISPIATAYIVKATAKDPQLDLVSTGELLNESAKRMAAGDMSELETILYSQSIALNTLFNSLALTAISAPMPYKKDYMGMALKVQNQSRATILGLMKSKKEPARATFIKQANITSGNQQVNNGHILAENKLSKQKTLSIALNPPSKLLKDQSHVSTNMDSRTKRTATPSNQEVETVGAINGGNNARR